MTAQQKWRVSEEGRAYFRAYQKGRYAKMTPEQRAKVSSYHRERRARATPEEKAAQSERTRRWWAGLSEQQRRDAYEKHRQRRKKRPLTSKQKEAKAEYTKKWRAANPAKVHEIRSRQAKKVRPPKMRECRECGGIERHTEGKFFRGQQFFLCSECAKRPSEPLVYVANIRKVCDRVAATSPSDEWIEEAAIEIEKLILGFKPLEQKIINARFYKNLNYAQIGRKIGLSRERVRQIEFGVLRKMRRRKGPLMDFALRA